MDENEQLITVAAEENPEDSSTQTAIISEQPDLSESEGDPDNDGEYVDENGNPIDDTEQEVEDPSEADDHMAEQVEQSQQEAQTVAQLLESKGIDYDAMIAEYEQYGALTDRTYADLEKAGYPRTLVDNYCAGQQARYDQWCDHVRSMAGGSEQYDELMSYASHTMTPREKNAFDAAVNSGDPQTARIAVDALMYRYQQANPSEGYDYEGGSAAREPAVSGYTSIDDAFAATDDPRYYTDPEYRHVHELRLLRTPFLQD